MQTFNILQSKSKIYSNFTFTEPEIYFFRSGKRITITKFIFFLLVTLSKINTLCLGDETKSGEKQR